jgi:hypothetical protein
LAFVAWYAVSNGIADFGAGAEFVIGNVLAGVQVFVAGVHGAVHGVVASGSCSPGAAGLCVADLYTVAVFPVVAVDVLRTTGGQALAVREDFSRKAFLKVAAIQRVRGTGGHGEARQ